MSRAKGLLTNILHFNIYQTKKRETQLSARKWSLSDQLIKFAQIHIVPVYVQQLNSTMKPKLFRDITRLNQRIGGFLSHSISHPLTSALHPAARSLPQFKLHANLSRRCGVTHPVFSASLFSPMKQYHWTGSCGVVQGDELAEKICLLAAPLHFNTGNQIWDNSVEAFCCTVHEHICTLSYSLCGFQNLKGTRYENVTL